MRQASHYNKLIKIKIASSIETTSEHIGASRDIKNKSQKSEPITEDSHGPSSEPGEPMIQAVSEEVISPPISQQEIFILTYK